ncbi:MAG: glycosyltransferase family 2 protein [Candidatus Omnitrophica bacterium]|nr:glycosyltransferase family 2 protein [Candidatus Omnitrophota bacterium]
MEALFWVFFILIVYTYAGYPFALLVLSKWRNRPALKAQMEPAVTVILSAFNEQKWIEAKLFNLLNMDYPEKKIEILVGSDGASDATDQIISKVRSPRVRFFRFVSNLGKPNVLNALAKEAHGAILIFTDARQEFDRKAIRMLVRNFNDPSVGCVSGELYFRQEGSGRIEKGMDAYWRYEKFLRKKESEIGSMLGATGAIYAIRREWYTELPLNILVDDMYLPLHIVHRGYRAVFESEAKAFDVPSQKSNEEFKRKVRTLAGNYQVFFLLPALLVPWKSSVAWQLFSHKLLRLLIPFFLVGIFAVNLFLLDSAFYRVSLAAQFLFYGLALREWLSERMGIGKRSVGYIPYMFCLLNYCAFIGLIRFLEGRQKAAWERAYA